MPARRTVQFPEPPSWSEWRAQHQQKPWYRRYPLAVEWLFEQANDRLHRWAFIEFLEHVGKFTVLIAVIVWVFEADNRAKERHYRAWELINSARGSSGDGGRIDALEDLKKDGVSLAATPLKKAWLQEVDLAGAILRGADLRGAYLEKANLGEADLWGANLERAILVGADLRGAILVGADLRGAYLEKANLAGADLRGADLEKAILVGADLRGANLVGADLRGAYLEKANLVGAYLEKANLGEADLWMAILVGADLREANLLETEYLTQVQLDSALGNDNTLLPEHLTRPAHWMSSKSEELIE